MAVQSYSDNEYAPQPPIEVGIALIIAAIIYAFSKND